MGTCGICDTCLKKKSSAIDKDEFEKISNRIKTVLGKRNIQSNQLLSELEGIRKEKALKVIEFMQSENKIAVDSKGLLSLKSSSSATQA